MRGLAAAGTAASLVLVVATAALSTSVGVEGALFGVGGGDAGSDALVAAASSDEAYQEEVLQRCQSIWPKRYKHGYAHHSGAMMEEFFFTRWQKRRPVLPQIYLPIGWSTYFFSAARVEPFQPEEVARARSEVTALLEWLDKGRSYFSVQQFAGLLAAERPGVPCDLKLTMFVGGGPEDSAYAPHVTFVPIPLLSKVLAPLRRPRFDMVTFSGGFLFWQDPGGIRTDMRTTLQNETGFTIQERVGGWEALIQGSVFHLCPRGNGPTSYRLYESLQAGTIPIYVWEEAKWLAFEDVIEWESIALVVHRSDMASIPALVAASDAAAMRANILRSRSMWRYNYTSQYIVGRVQATAGDPTTRAYRPNSTECVPSGGSQGSAAAAAAGPALQHDVAHALAETTLAVDGVLASAAVSSSGDGSSGKPASSEGIGIVASGGAGAAGGGSSASARDKGSSTGGTAQAVDQGAEENYDVGSWDFVGSGARRGGVSGFFSGLFSTVAFVAAVLACMVVVRAVRRRLRRSGNRGAINRRLTY